MSSIARNGLKIDAQKFFVPVLVLFAKVHVLKSPKYDRYTSVVILYLYQ